MLTVRGLAAAVAVSGLLAGCGPAASADHSAHRPLRAAAADKTVAVEGTPAEVALLNSILAGFPSELASISVGQPADDTGMNDGQASWLTMERNAGGGFSDTVRQRWESIVIAGAYAEDCGAAGVACPAGFTVTTASGQESGDVGGRITLADNLSKKSESELQQLAESDADRLGLSSVSVSTSRLGSLPIVRISATSSDPSAFLTAFHSDSTLVGGESVAFLLTVGDGNGNQVMASGWDGQLQAGVAWVNPKMNPGQQIPLASTAGTQ